MAVAQIEKEQYIASGLQKQLENYVRAGFTGIWINTFEHLNVITEICQLREEHGWNVTVWDSDLGLRLVTDEGVIPVKELKHTPAKELLAVSTPAHAAALARNWFDHDFNPEDDSDDRKPPTPHMVVLRNFHSFAGMQAQVLQNTVELCRRLCSFTVVLSALQRIPPELEKDFVVIDYSLPNKEELLHIAGNLLSDDEMDLLEEAETHKAVEAARGLTRIEAENAFSLSLVQCGIPRKLEYRSVWAQKKQMVAKSGLLNFYEGTEKLTDLGGLGALKSFCLKALLHKPDAIAKPRGILLIGPPGTGKSAIAKALGNAVGRPTISLDLGSLMGSLVGQTEAQTRHALQIIDACSPAILMVEEVEKALAGTRSSGQTDGGIMARMFGTLLAWLNDHESDVFCVMTCNGAESLPPEFTRSERFDATFFLDLPTKQEKAAIWPMYIKHFKLTPEQTENMPMDEDWTGAEIRACCRLASLLELSLMDSAINIRPVAMTAKESLDSLRTWASARCLSASYPGAYNKDKRATALPTKAGRQILKPGQNN